jgi:hypothetical protein
MTRTTKSSSSSTSDEAPSNAPDLEHHVTGMTTVIHDLSLRLNNTDSQVEQLSTHFNQFSTQHAGVPDLLQLLVDKVDKMQTTQNSIPQTTQSNPTRIERTLPYLTDALMPLH